MLIIASTMEEAEVRQHRGSLHDTPDLVTTLRPWTLINRRLISIDEFIEEADLLWVIQRARVFSGQIGHPDERCRVYLNAKGSEAESSADRVWDLVLGIDSMSR
jgi:hypothetical protein